MTTETNTETKRIRSWERRMQALAARDTEARLSAKAGQAPAGQEAEGTVMIWQHIYEAVVGFSSGFLTVTGISALLRWIERKQDK